LQLTILTWFRYCHNTPWSSFKRTALLYYASEYNLGKSDSNVEAGKRKDTGPLGVVDANKPSAITSCKTRCAVLAGKPVILDAWPRSNCPDRSASFNNADASGFNVS